MIRMPLKGECDGYSSVTILSQTGRCIQGFDAWSERTRYSSAFLYQEREYSFSVSEVTFIYFFLLIDGLFYGTR